MQCVIERQIADHCNDQAQFEFDVVVNGGIVRGVDLEKAKDRLATDRDDYFNFDELNELMFVGNYDEIREMYESALHEAITFELEWSKE